MESIDLLTIVIGILLIAGISKRTRGTLISLPMQKRFRYPRWPRGEGPPLYSLLVPYLLMFLHECRLTNRKEIYNG